MKYFIKENKKRIQVALLVIVLVLMSVGIVYKMNESNTNDDKKIVEKDNKKDDKKDNKDKEDVKDKEDNKKCTVEDTWKAETAYTGGAEVIYNGKKYKAKWWTQNEKPGENDVWQDTGVAAGTCSDDKDNDKDVGPTIVDKEAPGDKDFKVVAYYPSWKPGGTAKLQYDVLTHVNYAFAIPNADGTLKPLENADLAKKIINSAHKSNVKVLIAIGGWSYNDVPLEATFMSATATDALTEKFANNIVKMCDEYGFDGVDMDWEHPRRDGTSSKQYEKLMLKLADKLHAKGKLLTSAVLSGATPDGQPYYDAAAHTDAVLKSVDWINVMAYDGGDGDRHSTYQFAQYCGNYWKNTRKMPAHKVVLGVPFYGRPSWESYENFLKADKDAYNKDVVNYNGMEAHYNGIPTITKKTKYAKSELGGIMIWEITHDTTDKAKSLLTAIGKALK